jgi:uncharacterized protein (TIGR02808 family)
MITLRQHWSNAMSALEEFIWNVLGYSAMPFIFITGFVISAVVICFVLEKLGHGGER